jgi:hypothetical protein
MSKFESYRKWLNERFTEENDPIADMGIGIINSWKKDVEDMKSISDCREVYDKYFKKYCDNNKYEFYYSEISRVIYWTLKYLIDDTSANQQNVFEKTLKTNDIRDVEIIKKIVEILKNKYHLNVKYKENIFEIFTNDNSDPIHDMGIGMNTIENIKPGDVIICLKSSKNFLFKDGSLFPVDGVYIVKYVKRLSKTKLYLDLIPYGFERHKYIFTKDGSNKRARCRMGVSVDNSHGNTATISKWKKYFKIMQQRELKESLNEKFTEEGDPIEDMGIGMRKIWADQAKKFGKTAVADNLKKYMNVDRGDLDYSKYISCPYVIYSVIFAASKGKNVQEIFEEIVKEQNIENQKIIAKMAEVLKHYFHIDVNSEINVEESLNEKFTQDSDPIEDMGIGIDNQFKKWCKSKRIRYEYTFITLVECIKNKKYDFVKLFIDKGINLNSYDRTHSAGVFLRFAAYHNDIKMIDILLDGGVIPTYYNVGKWVTEVSNINSKTKEYIFKKIKEYKKR